MPSGAAESTAHQSLGSGSLSHALVRASQASSIATVDLKNASQLPPTHHPTPTRPRIGPSPHPGQRHYHRARPLPFPRPHSPSSLRPRGTIAVLVASAPSLHRHIDVMCMAYKVQLSDTIICDSLLAVKWAATDGWGQASATPILPPLHRESHDRLWATYRALPQQRSAQTCLHAWAPPCAATPTIGAPSCPRRPTVPCTPAA